MSEYDLPLELICEIVRHLSGGHHYNRDRYKSYHSERLAPYATVSSKWRTAVEKITFSNLFLNPGRLHELRERGEELLRPDRRPHIRSIKFDVVLRPRPPDTRTPRAGTLHAEELRDADNALFTYHIWNFLDWFLKWTADEASGDETNGDGISVPSMRPGVSLSLECRYPGKRSLPATGKPESDDHPVPDDDLPDASTIPPQDDLVALIFKKYKVTASARAITDFKFMDFEINGAADYKVDSIFGLLSHFPNAKRLEIPFWDNHRLRRDNRRFEFGQSLLKLPTTVDDLSLRYYSTGTQQVYVPESLLLPGLSVDPLSAGIRHVSQTLRSLKVTSAIIDRGVFWTLDLNMNPEAENLCWPRLEILNIIYYPVTARGENMMISRDRDWWPVREIVNDFHHAAALAASRMPRLKKLLLEVKGNGVEGRFCPTFEYTVDREGAIARFSGFDLTDEVEEAWKAAARIHTNCPVTQLYLRRNPID